MPGLAPNGDDYGASFLTNSSGSLAIFAAIRRASSLVRRARALSTAKSRSAAAKKRVQRVSVAGCVFSLAGYALPLDALLPID